MKEASAQMEQIRKDLVGSPGSSVPALIEQYRAEKMPKRFSTRRGYESFPSNRGSRPLNISQFAQRTIAPLLKLKDIAWHGLYAGRRGAATLLLQLTGNAVASQYLLRHRNIATTQGK